MKIIGLLFCTLLLPPAAAAQQPTTQQPPPGTPTLKINSALVFLDATVVDKKGNPVTTGADQGRLYDHRGWQAATDLLV